MRVRTAFFPLAGACCAIALFFALRPDPDPREPADAVREPPAEAQETASAQAPSPRGTPKRDATIARLPPPGPALAPPRAGPASVPDEKAAFAPPPDDPASREALQCFLRDASASLERCAGVVGGARAPVPVQLVFRRSSPPDQEWQAFVAVAARALPSGGPDGVAIAAPESERCLAAAFAAAPLFLPRASSAAGDFTETVSLVLPTTLAVALPRSPP